MLKFVVMSTTINEAITPFQGSGGGGGVGGGSHLEASSNKAENCICKLTLPYKLTYNYNN